MAILHIGLPEFLVDLRSAVLTRRAAFLVGAGVSMIGPSPLLSGPQVKDALVGSIAARHGLAREFNGIKRSRAYQAITPEIIFQSLHECINSRLLPFFEILGGGLPNSLHRSFSQYVKRNMGYVLTTNFDTLIERAGGFRSTPPSILHLHGSLKDKASLVVRILQIGKAGIGPVYSNAIKALNGKTLFVMGYSGSDIDILRMLEKSECLRILWLARDPKDTLLTQRLQSVGKRHEVAIVGGDLRLVARYMSRLVPSGRRTITPAASVNRADVAQSWSKTVDQAEARAFLVKVLGQLGQYQKAAALAVRTADKKLNSSAFPPAWFYNEAAEDQRCVGNFRVARAHVQKALSLRSYSPRTWTIAGTHNISGILSLEKARPDPTRAIRSARLALNILRRDRSAWRDSNGREYRNMFLGRIYNNLGLAYETAHQWSRSLQAYRRALSFKTRTGDILGSALTCANISILSLRAGKLGRHRYWKKRALVLMDRYELRFQRAYLARRIGEILCDQGQYDDGLQYLRDALREYRLLGSSKRGIAMTEKAIARNQRK